MREQDTEVDDLRHSRLFGRERQRRYHQRQRPRKDQKKKAYIERPTPWRAMLLAATAAGVLAGALGAAITTAAIALIRHRALSTTKPMPPSSHTSQKTLQNAACSIPAPAHTPTAFTAATDARQLHAFKQAELFAGAPNTGSPQPLWPPLISSPIPRLRPLVAPGMTPLAAGDPAVVAAGQESSADGHSTTTTSLTDVRERVTTIVNSAIVHETDMPETMQALALVCAQALIDAGRKNFADDLVWAFNRWFMFTWQGVVVQADSRVTFTRSSLHRYIRGTFISFTLEGQSVMLYKDC